MAVRNGNELRCGTSPGLGKLLRMQRFRELNEKLTFFALESPVFDYGS